MRRQMNLQFLEGNMKYFKDEIDKVFIAIYKDKKYNWDNGIWLIINTKNIKESLNSYELQKNWIEKNVNGFVNALRGILQKFKEELKL